MTSLFYFSEVSNNEKNEYLCIRKQMKPLLHIIVLTCAILVGTQASAQSVFVPLDHQVYPLLVKGETLGMFDSYRMRLLPLSRTEVLFFLKSMSRQAQDLSNADKELLDFMLGEFTDPEIGADEESNSERHVYRFEEGEVQLFLDTRVVQEFRISRGRVTFGDETLSETSAFGSVRVRFGEHVFIGASARSSLLRGEKNPQSNFNPSEGTPQVAVGQNVFTDQATGYIGLEHGRLRLYAGRMHLSWGSGLDERLGLSQSNEPMDMLHFTLDFERVRFSYMHANFYGIGSDRYLAGLRLDFRLSDGVYLGAYETVVYARRGVRLAYLNPFVPYHFIEHQEGDRDNNMIGVDISAVVSPGVRLFGEVFIDDLNWSKPIFDYWGNKLAYQAGIHWASPFDVKPLEVRASYTRVDPWVYTHNDSLNVYTHYDASLGARIGPNADRYAVAIRLRPHSNWLVDVSYQAVRRGQGHFSLAHRAEDGEEKRFLEGVLEKVGQLSVGVRYQFIRDIFAGGEAVFTRREQAALVPGLTAQEQFFRLFLDINY